MADGDPLTPPERAALEKSIRDLETENSELSSDVALVKKQNESKTENDKLRDEMAALEVG